MKQFLIIIIIISDTMEKISRQTWVSKKEKNGKVRKREKGRKEESWKEEKK